MSVLLACAAALCFGCAMVTSRLGMRECDARAGAATSVPVAAAFFCVVSLGWLDATAFDWRAAAIFALVGLFFPAAATLVNFASTQRIGPSLTSSIGGTAPLFAIVAAFALLGEPVPAKAAVAAAGVVAGVALMSWGRTALDARRAGPLAPLLLLPVAGAAVRGLAQVLAKAGLAIWPSPLAATLIGYVVSAAVLVSADRARANRTRPGTRARLLFAATGLLNGVGLLATYAALRGAPVAVVSPIVAAYPLVTLVASRATLRDEPVGARGVAGALLTVAAVAWLLGA